MRVRAVICGGPELATSAAALGLIPTDDARADIALLDLRDGAAIAKAAALRRDLPRVVVIGEAEGEIVRALGIANQVVATSCEPAALGPLIASVLPAARRHATRSILVTAARGGAGTSLLAANLARRLAPSHATLALDVTGGAGLGWWLGASPAGWQDLEGLADELSAQHLAVVATEAVAGLRLAGGPPLAPSVAVARAALRAGLELCELVVVDAPNIAELRTKELAAMVDRVLVLTYDDPVSLAALATSELPPGAWIIGSQSTASAMIGREIFRSLPRSDRDIAAAAGGARVVGGALGAAYDELADLLLIDTT